ncbi:MAG: hypothetical protein KDA93_00350 [Planctomycetaceae bacterium]|nr:hypothetical protein [Planctomycetaceae bacterium]
MTTLDTKVAEPSEASPVDEGLARISTTRRLAAWSVHLFTASGAVFCLLALDATYASDWQLALFWLVIAVAVDAVDGTFARMARVKDVIPTFDGTTLDNMIDFFSYVIVPAMIIHRSGVLPADASFATVCAICLASAFQFCQGDAKTPDHYFTGFPSYWNITAMYLLAMKLSPAINLAIVITLMLLVFVPVKYIYVNRTRPFRRITLPLTVVWSLMGLAILWQLPDPHPWLVWVSLLYVVYYAVMSFSLTLQMRRQR